MQPGTWAVRRAVPGGRAGDTLGPVAGFPFLGVLPLGSRGLGPVLNSSALCRLLAGGLAAPLHNAEAWQVER